jgi:Domain of unknown function (DUF4253)
MDSRWNDLLIMPSSNENNSFIPLREARTCAPNYSLDTEAIIERLEKWQSACEFTITSAEPDAVDIQFATLPKDMDTFVRDIYDLCPDIVDQGTGCIREMVEEIATEEITSEMRRLIEGVNFEDEDYGLEILKRTLEETKKLTLWWD